MSSAAGGGVTLQLLWPQWQGAGTSNVGDLAPEFPFEVARLGVCGRVRGAGRGAAGAYGPTATAPVAMGDEGLAEQCGVEAEDVIVRQLGQAFERHPGT